MRAVIAAALRTPVTPRNGDLSKHGIAELTAPLVAGLLDRTGLSVRDVDDVILGNALYAGGNPARLAALQAGLPDETPATTLDTQCCSGLDAILMAAERIASGAADVIIAGGAESWSNAPQRARRSPQGEWEVYSRPPFAPWSERDPDPLVSAAEFASERGCSRTMQEDFAIESHRKACAPAVSMASEILTLGGVARDSYARALSQSVCTRSPVLAGQAPCAISAAAVAVEADAAALVLVVSEHRLRTLQLQQKAVMLQRWLRLGGAPERPQALAGLAARDLLRKSGIAASQLAAVELMEAFAVQAMVNIADAGLDPAKVNRSGGALARGHPIGASGAILAVRLFHELQQEAEGALGLAAIAAAGGLASAVILQNA